MWLFNKKSKEAADVSLLHTDIHSHVIPGIDDGAPTMEDSINLVREMYNLGYRRMIVTPHVRFGSFENDTDTFDARLELLEMAADKENLDMEFEIGAEHTIDENFRTLFKEDKLKTFNDGWLLIEFPFTNLPPRWKELIFDLQMAGYKLILAHPERYVSYLSFEKKTIDELKNRDILFQMNITSLGGFYGKNVLKFARYLVEKEYVDILGSDLHNMRHIEYLKQSFRNKDVCNLIESGCLMNNKF
ncbi:MAG: hypothetical protein IJ748_04220 [Bacteroidales bacterium]|nr:hypothetical protein [Bacteroidales bacterium]